MTFVWHWITNWIIGWGGIGALVSIAALALWYFTPSILTSSKSLILHVAVGATVFTFASTYFFTDGYNNGYAVAINQVAAKNKEASDAVQKATSNVDQCFASGGTFDDVAGVCIK